MAMILRWPWIAIAVLVFVIAAPFSSRAQQIGGAQGFDDPGYAWSRSWVDFNGDGRSDYCILYAPDADKLACYAATGQGFEASPSTFSVGMTASGYGVRWVDINGDGRLDVCKVRPWMDWRYTIGIISDCYPSPSFSFSGGHSVKIPSVQLRYEEWLPRVLYWTDLNADGRSDMCYVTVSGEITCFLAGDAGFTQSTAWTRAGVGAAATAWFSAPPSDWPQEFVDFNGDGYPDFCRVLGGGSVRCLLGGRLGFGEDVGMPAVSIEHAAGAAFVDFNADGKTDFCRPVGSYLRCSLSNGMSWDPVDRISPTLNLGHDKNRWWVDINADGFPDYCRPLGDPDSGAPPFACRLSRGDGDEQPAPNVVYAFANEDVQVGSIEFGMSDGGRGFCDPLGNGVQTLCRVIKKEFPAEPYCDGDTCYPQTTTKFSLLAGLTEEPQATLPLIQSVNGGIGAETRISYLPMTSPEVYTRSGLGTYPRALISMSTRPLVYETRAWATGSTPTTLTGNARYFYRDLRIDQHAGSRGFRERWMFNEGTNTMDHTVFFQGLGPEDDSSSRLDDPLEIGMVKMQERYVVKGGIQPTPGTGSERDQLLDSIRKQAHSGVSSDAPYSPYFSLLERTSNSLSDTTPIANPRYRFIGGSSTKRYDYNGTAIPLPISITASEQDNFGNVYYIRETATLGDLTWTTKITTNTYDPDERWRRMGRLKASEVVSTLPSIDQQMASYPRSAGTSPNAASTSLATPAPPPLKPEVLMGILQLLLED